MLQFIARMKAESSELDARIKKASTILEQARVKLAVVEVQLLNKQLEAMTSYSEVLKQRIDYEVDKHGN